MLFNDFNYFIFLPIVLLLYYVLPKSGRNNLLLLASYVFYSFWDWRFLLLLILSTLIDYFFGIIIYQAQGDRKKKIFLWLSIVNNLGILAIFKYYDFFITSFQNMLAGMGVQSSFPLLHIILPVGISFYTFHGMSYVFDIYRKQVVPTRNFVNYSLFVSYFPLLVAGPIERAHHLLPQIENRDRVTSKEHIIDGLLLIFLGYIRKVLISDNIGPLTDQVFNNYQNCSSFELLAGVLFFTFQIYFDFSGYSDIARGTSKLFGLDLLINFNQPYLSQNIAEFWKRWHISLSSWLRDYLYIGLGGNRKGNTRTYINLMLTMLLGGLWHGASWNFVLWGGLHGTYLVIHRMLGGNNKTEPLFDNLNARKILNVLFTFSLVVLTWLPFRASSFEQTWYFLQHIALWNGAFKMDYLLLLLLLFAATLLLDIPAYRKGFHTPIKLLPKWILYFILITGTMGVLFTMIINQNSVRPFIYFQF